MDIDEVLGKIGDFGPSQKKIYYLCSFIQTWTAVPILLQSFIGVAPGWSCAVDSSHQLLKASNNNECLYYEQDKCSPEYSTEFTSIVTQWDLICGKSSLPNFAQSGFFVGLLIGAWVFGTLADMIGRKKVYFLTGVCSSVCTIASGLVPSFFLFVFFRVATAFFTAGLILSAYSIVMEVTGISQRTYAGLGVQVFYGLGYVFLAALAYFIRGWRALSVVGGLTGFLFLFISRVVPESPRWLLISGREEEAREVLGQLARDNGTQLPVGELKRPPSSGGEKASMLDLFRGRNIRWRTIMLVIAWFTDCMVYYALAMSAGSLGGNLYVSFSLSGLADVPSAVVTYLLLNRIGRKWTHGGLLFVGSFGCLAWTALHLLGSSSSLKVIAALTGKFAVAGSFGTVYLYSAELFPTQVRSLGMGLVSMGARLGGILSPLVLLLSSTSAVLPMLLMGALALLTGLLSLTLPETLNKSLPETLAELES